MPSTPASQSVQTTDDAPSSPLIGEPDKNDVVLPLEYRALTFLRSCKQKASSAAESEESHVYRTGAFAKNRTIVSQIK